VLIYFRFSISIAKALYYVDERTSDDDDDFYYVLNFNPLERLRLDSKITIIIKTYETQKKNQFDIEYEKSACLFFKATKIMKFSLSFSFTYFDFEIKNKI